MEMSMLSLSGFSGLLLLALDIWALVSIIGSNTTTGRKVLWSLLVFLLPLVGFLIWLVAGPRAEMRRA
ncbi:MAG: PLDc_N domain-containing protein [Pseudooceanicola sp.]|nr:PLDc_N domain-containing protein [Pseudooceanicola sp.]